MEQNLVTLPTEVLKYIVSFLPTRDIARIRCVSKVLRAISEIPSLWETFVWSYYTPRDDELLEYIIKTFGEDIKKIRFTDDVAPSKLVGMLQYCKNVIHLSLPTFDNVEILEKIVGHITTLEILDIQGTNSQQKQILKSSSNLKVLSIHLILYSYSYLDHQVKQWFEEWANSNYVPRTLNIIIFTDEWHELRTLVLSLQLAVLRNKKFLKDLSTVGCFNICVNTSVEFSQMLPYIQIQVTNSSVALPSVKASKYGLVGLDMDTLHLTQGSYRGKKIHKVLLIGGIDERIDTSVTSLSSITYFDAAYCGMLNSNHLEQLSIACPNLQRLDLCGNSECLSDLQGLHSLSSNCKNMQGLNLHQIHEDKSECDRLQLWEILCIMRLTELSIEGWMINVHVAEQQQKLMSIFQKYSSLQVLEMNGFGSQNKLSNNELLLVSCFPSITSYRINDLPSDNISNTLKCIFDCQYLQCLYLSQGFNGGMLSLSLEGHCSSLQQLYIDSKDAAPTEAFIDALCSHGRLEHVILCVKSLTARSIINVIEQSSNLMIFCTVLYSRPFTETQIDKLVSSIETNFSKRRLFNGGTFYLTQYPMDYTPLMFSTKLLSVWSPHNC